MRRGAASARGGRVDGVARGHRRASAWRRLHSLLLLKHLRAHPIRLRLHVDVELCLRLLLCLRLRLLLPCLIKLQRLSLWWAPLRLHLHLNLLLCLPVLTGWLLLLILLLLLLLCRDTRLVCPHGLLAPELILLLEGGLLLLLCRSSLLLPLELLLELHLLLRILLRQLPLAALHHEGTLGVGQARRLLVQRLLLLLLLLLPVLLLDCLPRRLLLLNLAPPLGEDFLLALADEGSLVLLPCKGLSRRLLLQQRLLLLLLLLLLLRRGFGCALSCDLSRRRQLLHLRHFGLLHLQLLLLAAVALVNGRWIILAKELAHDRASARWRARRDVGGNFVDVPRLCE